MWPTSENLLSALNFISGGGKLLDSLSYKSQNKKQKLHNEIQIPTHPLFSP